MGPGLIGCEFANDLINVEKQVTVIGPDKWPLERLMPQPPGEALKAALAEQGVEWILGHVVCEVNRHRDGLSITLDNGEMLEADLVLSAAGLIPNTDLARAAGIDTAFYYSVPCAEPSRTSPPAWTACSLRRATPVPGW